MLATCRTTSEETCPISPCSLEVTSKAQLTTLAVAALKLHLKHFKLQTAGNKAALVDCVHSHLQADAHKQVSPMAYREMPPITSKLSLPAIHNKVHHLSKRMALPCCLSKSLTNLQPSSSKPKILGAQVLVTQML